MKNDNIFKRKYNSPKNMFKELVRTKDANKKKEEQKPIALSSLKTDNAMYEQIYVDKSKPKFAVWDGEEVDYVDTIKFSPEIIPIYDETLTSSAVILPEKAEEFGSLKKLIKEIRKHIIKYVDISDKFVNFGVYYVLLSWIFDKLTVVPYLRFLGDFGTGKSRAMEVIGRLCYKNCIVSGAITPAPIYRMIKKWGGTILFEEADFRDSSEKNEIMKILNCGWEKNKPVIRCKKDDPDSLQILPVYAPKIFTSRRTFYDKALESRCLTEVMKETEREDIPAILPEEFYKEQTTLRNKLLMFRFKYYDKMDTKDIARIKIKGVDPRLKQAISSFTILFSAIPEMKKEFEEFLNEYRKELVSDRSTSFEGLVVNALHELKAQQPVSSQDIANFIDEKYKPYGKKGAVTSSQKVGIFLKQLGLVTRRIRVDGSQRRAVVFDTHKLSRLYEKYVEGTSVTTATISYVDLSKNNNKSIKQGVSQYPIEHVAHVNMSQWIYPKELPLSECNYCKKHGKVYRYYIKKKKLVKQCKKCAYKEVEDQVEE